MIWWAMAIVCVLAACLGWWQEAKHQRAMRVGAEERERQVNEKLWKLLSDSDPAWLVAMGIEGQRASKPSKAVLSNEPGAPIFFEPCVIQTGSIQADRIVAGAIFDITQDEKVHPLWYGHYGEHRGMIPPPPPKWYYSTLG